MGNYNWSERQQLLSPVGITESFTIFWRDDAPGVPEKCSGCAASLLHRAKDGRQAGCFLWPIKDFSEMMK